MGLVVFILVWAFCYHLRKGGMSFGQMFVIGVILSLVLGAVLR
jgi:hypothetical protein